MLKLENGMYLYHGSYIEVKNIDLNKSGKNKDFGRGFYLTTSKEQAINFIHLSLNKAKLRNAIDASINKGYISIFRIMKLESLNIKYFHEADVEWLHFVSANRDDGIFQDVFEKYKNIDIYVGKIANDRTAITLQAYLAGLYGEVGTKDADETTIKVLLPNKLENQVCIKTEKAKNCLDFIGSEEYD